MSVGPVTGDAVAAGFRGCLPGMLRVSPAGLLQPDAFCRNKAGEYHVSLDFEKFLPLAIFYAAFLLFSLYHTF